MSKIMFFDNKASILDKYIDERTGNLHVKAKVSRDGIQEYLGVELGVDGLEPYTKYNVYRPLEEVTSDESLKTIVNAPVTDNHPNDFVTKDNSDQLTKGVGLNYKVIKDGKDTLIEVDLIVTDKNLIRKIQDGKVEISLGYDQNLVKADGTYDGISYQFKQTDIRVNHIAIVDAGRCGAKCKITLDNTAKIDNVKKINGGKQMPKITIDGVDHEITDCVAKHISGLNSSLTDAQTTISTLQKDMEAEKAKADMSEEELKKAKEDMEKEKSKSTDSAINDAVSQKLSLIDTAKKMQVDCKIEDSNDTIKKAIIAKAYPNLSLDGKSDAYMDAMMDAVSEKMKEDEEHQEEIKKSQDSASSGFKQKDGLIEDSSTVAARIADKKASAFKMPGKNK